MHINVKIQQQEYRESDYTGYFIKGVQSWHQHWSQMTWDNRTLFTKPSLDWKETKTKCMAKGPTRVSFPRVASRPRVFSGQITANAVLPCCQRAVCATSDSIRCVLWEPNCMCGNKLEGADVAALEGRPSSPPGKSGPTGSACQLTLTQSPSSLGKGTKS